MIFLFWIEIGQNLVHCSLLSMFLSSADEQHDPTGTGRIPHEISYLHINIDHAITTQKQNNTRIYVIITPSRELLKDKAYIM